MNNYFSQKCPHCGNMMYISSNSDKVVCLNCNKEFEVDKDLLEEFNKERNAKVEKTLLRKKKNKRIDRIVLFFLFVILVLYSLSFMLSPKSENDTIKILYSSHYFRNEKLSLEETIKKLKNNGFSNIEYQAIYDIYFGIIKKEREVEKVIVNGSDIYIKGDKFPKDAKVVIYYHDRSENEVTENNDEAKERIPDYYGTFIGNDKSILIIGKDKNVYYYKNLIYDEDVVCYEENNKVMLDVKSLGYKIYFDTRSQYDADFEVKSTNEKWNTEKFVRISNEVNYTKDEMNRIITSSTALKRMRVETVNNELELDGYTNIILEPMYDVILGFLVNTGDVDRISINGETQFDSYLDYPKDSIIKIYYHEDISKDPTKVSNGE